jgi:hypothetical protein
MAAIIFSAIIRAIILGIDVGGSVPNIVSIKAIRRENWCLIWQDFTGDDGNGTGIGGVCLVHFAASGNPATKQTGVVEAIVNCELFFFFPWALFPALTYFQATVIREFIFRH